MRDWRNILAKAIYRTIFSIGERFGLHITPNHFYFPIPDTRKLKDELWNKQSELVGINMGDERQLDLLRSFVSMYKDEYDSFPHERDDVKYPYEYFVNNRRFESVDGEVLYSMIRYFKPKRIYEVGSGYSTYLMAQAIMKNKSENKDYKAELVVIDPYPDSVIKNGFPGLSGISQKKVQDVPVSEFEKLGENDILFIDSSHVLTIGSDVQYEYLEIIPRLKKGVIVHLHDIFLPAEYPKDWVKKEYRFWNEQYVLQAFMAFNESFEVLLAASYLHLKYPSILESSFSSYDRKTRWPGSFWIRRIK